MKKLYAKKKNYNKNKKRKDIYFFIRLGLLNSTFFSRKRKVFKNFIIKLLFSGALLTIILHIFIKKNKEITSGNLIENQSYSNDQK